MGMGRLCVFDNCSTNSCLIKPRNVQLHRFPPDPVIKSKWEKWVRDVGGPGYEDFVATKSTHTICSKHFKSSDYLRKRLCYQAIPHVPPEPSANVSAGFSPDSPLATISNIRSLAERRSQNGSRITGANTKTHGKTFVPLTRSQVQGGADILPVALLPHNKRLRSSTRVTFGSGPIFGSGPTNIVPEGAGPDTRSKAQSSTPTVKHSPSPSSQQENSPIQTTSPGNSSSDLLSQQENSPIQASSSGNSSSDFLRSLKGVCVCVEPIQPEMAHQPKRKCYVGDISTDDYECPVKAEKCAAVVANETAKTQQKLRTMQLKYIRAMRKINTLVDVINQLKEDKCPLDEGFQIKVCSSCRKINLCR